MQDSGNNPPVGTDSIFFRVCHVVIDPNFSSLRNFHGLPPFVFGFDNHKPPEVSIMYPYRICNIFGQFDGLASAKKFIIV